MHRGEVVSRVPLIMVSALAIVIASCTGDENDEYTPRSVPYMDMIDLELNKVFQAPDGAVAKREHLKGKVVVIEFWATWCGPCMPAITHMNQLVEECKNDPIQFISVTYEDERVVREFLDKHPISGWVGIDSPSNIDNLGATAKRFGAEAIPHAVVIDQHGFLVSQTQPWLVTRDGLLNIMKERPYPPPSESNPSARDGG